MTIPGLSPGVAAVLLFGCAEVDPCSERGGLLQGVQEVWRPSDGNLDTDGTIAVEGDTLVLDYERDGRRYRMTAVCLGYHE